MLRLNIDRPVFHLILIAALGIAAYSNTFNVPFQWDGKNTYIVRNPIIKDLGYFLHPSKAEGLPHYNAFKSRYVGYLTFALNYRLGGTDVRGYHLFNTAVHVLNASLLYFLILFVFRSPSMSGASLEANAGHIGLLSGLVFVTHPVQTEAVTYIFQRLASLAAFFYLLSIVMYIKWRLTPLSSPLSLKGDRGWLPYLLSILSAVLAMKTKENAFTLPVMLVICEFFFFKTDGANFKKKVLYLFPFLLTLFIVPLEITGQAGKSGFFDTAEAVTGGYDAISRKDYLLTEIRVLVTYLRLLFAPYGQNLDYDYPVYHSLFNKNVYLSFLFMLSIAALALYLLYRSRISSSFRLVAFGIVWFFVSISVESSFVPLPMAIDEYRLYLPSAGAFMAITAGSFYLFGKIKAKRLAMAASFLIPMLLAVATYSRNVIWVSEVTLWEDVVKKSPGKARGHYNLGIAYARKGERENAVMELGRAAELAPEEPRVRNNLGIALREAGRKEEAIGNFIAAINADPSFAESRFNLALCYYEKGYIDEAQKELIEVIRLEPGHVQAAKFLAIIKSTGK